MNFRRSLKPESPGFQLAPMVDIVFILVFFFITAQLYSRWETELDITLPTARTGTLPQRLPGEVIINVTRDGRFIVNARELSEEEMSEMLDRLARLFPGQPVLVRADRRTTYERIIRLLDLCRHADIWNISFAALPPEE